MLKSKFEQLKLEWNCTIASIFDDKFCELLDSNDELGQFQDNFLFPRSKSSVSGHVNYLCGNSLGLQPKGVIDAVSYHLQKWANEGVEGHFTQPNQWLTIDDIVQNSSAQLVGALPHEVVIMNSLTCNLHLMMIPFYQPTTERYKIIIEKKAFPSDYQAVQSQIIFHGLDPRKCLIEVEPRQREELLRMEDIEKVLHEHGSTTSLVLFSGVQYYTGQLFNMKQITAVARECGCYVGFDLAHAVGNVILSLHEWGCDFACWCNYKYVNSGPGAIAGCFIHDRHSGRKETEIEKESDAAAPAEADRQGKKRKRDEEEQEIGEDVVPRRLAGWWGHRLHDRFQMAPIFRPCVGAYGFRLSNPPVLMVACLRASLDLFDKAGMERLREKSLLLTGYLEILLDEWLSDKVAIISPRDPEQRGCQLSLCFHDGNVEKVHAELEKHDIVCDIRKPDVMRIAPTPLYNSYRDVYNFVNVLKSIIL
mmetsp:Transcript_9639/g.9704  ORF Transcript_9639/g.9704 Transcript_9639/m.9704 type:complete len:477 (+) Transcript_9639:63-1493(+)